MSMRIKPTNATADRKDAFAMWDLLGLSVGLSLLVLGGMAWAGRVGTDSRSVLCVANLRQLASGWSSYSADHQGQLPISGGGGVSALPDTWAPGWLDFSRSPQNFDVTTTLARGQLWSYVGTNARAFRCPDDSTGVRVGTIFNQRIRSYSMNSQMTGSGQVGFWNPSTLWLVYTNVQQFAIDEPARRFVFTEEHPGSINDDMMIVDMTGYPQSPGSWRMLDFPAAFHSGSGTFVFADQHAEIKAWQDPRTSPSVMDRPIVLNVPLPGSPDVLWMQERTTRAVKP